MRHYRRYPVLETNLGAIRSNAQIVCDLCSKNGIAVAGVIKFSDGNLKVAEAFYEGGCSEIASSRTIQLKRVKKAMPEVKTMLIRIPMPSEAADVVRWCDISLNSEEKTLRKLDAAAGKYGIKHGVLLMLDVGDRREGVIGAEKLCALALLVERELVNLKLVGVGTSYACTSGLLPDQDNLGELAEGARRVEAAIGRKLDMVSGGSSINLMLFENQERMPPEINHLRIGTSIVNPLSMRINRGFKNRGMREDTFTLTAEIVEIGMKSSMAQGTGKNWAGQIVEFSDTGIRKRAVIALGNQDVGDAMQLVPLDADVTIVAASSDHTVLDITDSEREWNVGDKMQFHMYYVPMLYCFSTRNVSIRYI